VGTENNTSMRRAERVLEGELLAPESDQQRAVRERLKFLAWLLDSSIPIPGTPYTVGLDAIVGLFPFIGDLIGVLISSYIVAEANRLGVGRAILARMAFNVAVEGVIGIVPLIGDLFDAAWKANVRNVRLLDAWAERPHATRRASRLFLVLLTAALVGLAALSGWLLYLLITALFG
jgi:uncharacterized protein DUF4112